MVLKFSVSSSTKFKKVTGEGNLEQFFYNIFLFGWGEVLSAGSRVQSPVQLFLIGYAQNIT